MKVTKLERRADGKIEIELRCETCGGPIVQSSLDFGMDCANNCARQAYDQAKQDDPFVASMDRFFGELMGRLGK